MKKIREISVLKILIFPLLLVILGALIISVPINTNYTSANNFAQHSVDDGKFSMTMSATPRKSSPLPEDIRYITNYVDEEITYYCFKWSDLESLKFRFNSNIQNSQNTYTGYKFLLNFYQTDDLKTSLGTKEPITLHSGDITNNNFTQFDFFYYIDKNSEIKETSTSRKGNDFGIYKFDFVYTYFDENNEISVSIGDIYLAILPDDIDTINSSNLKLLYSVSSSDKLMNIFNIYFSNDDYKYVNPKYLQWNVIGVDQHNRNYVLTEKIKNDNPNFSNYETVWTSIEPEKLLGTNFIFNSNDIEGKWTVSCSIKKSDGTQKQLLQIKDLSTIKKAKPSYVWLILVIVFSVLLIFGIIALIIFNKKKEKVW